MVQGGTHRFCARHRKEKPNRLGLAIPSCAEHLPVCASSFPPGWLLEICPKNGLDRSQFITALKITGANQSYPLHFVGRSHYMVVIINICFLTSYTLIYRQYSMSNVFSSQALGGVDIVIYLVWNEVFSNDCELRSYKLCNGFSCRFQQ